MMEQGFAALGGGVGVGKKGHGPGCEGVSAAGSIFPTVSKVDKGGAAGPAGGCPAPPPPPPPWAPVEVGEGAEEEAMASDPDDIVGGGVVAKAKGAGLAKKAKASYEGYEVKSEDGSTVVGQLVYNHNSGSIDAHCARHKVGATKCHMNRTLRASETSGSRLAQGRPLGLLVAWLWGGCHADCREKKQHADLRTGKGEFAYLVAEDKRSRARERVESDPAFKNWHARTKWKERDRRPGEPAEPPGLA